MAPAYLAPDDDDTHSLPEIDPRDAVALALLGHDLRAALAEMIGGLRLISPEGLDPVACRQLDRARASGEMLARMMEHGLKTMLGDTEADAPEVVRLRPLLAELDLKWSGVAQDLGLRFQISPATDLPAVLHIDRVDLERLLANLIGNALKYAGQGLVELELRKGREGWLHLVLRDEGPGFPDAVLAGGLIFHQRPAGMTKPGSGMGLHIARNLVERMGGLVRLYNRPKGGAVVELDLPAAALPDDIDAPEDLTRCLVDKRVLIADDNDTSRAILGWFSHDLGAETVEARDGVEAMAKLESTRFDLAIVDVEMPRLSGLDLIRALRASRGPMSRLPVIAVTGHGDRASHDALRGAGANLVLLKPLTRKIDFSRAAAQVMPQATPAPALRELPIFEEERFSRLLEMAGPDVSRDLIARLIADLEKVEAELAVPAADWPELRDQSHVLISLAGTAGALRLHAEAVELNRLAHDRDASAVAAILPELRELLSTLIRHLRELSLTQKGAE